MSEVLDRVTGGRLCGDPEYEILLVLLLIPGGGGVLAAILLIDGDCCSKMTLSLKSIDPLNKSGAITGDLVIIASVETKFLF